MIRAFMDAQGGYYQLDVPDGAPLPAWVAGMTPADVLEPVITLPTPAEQIAALERETMLPRATREFMLSFMETTAIEQGAGQGFTAEQSIAALRAGNSGYRKVKELDEQIDALRAAQ